MMYSTNYQWLLFNIQYELFPLLPILPIAVLVLSSFLFQSCRFLCDVNIFGLSRNFFKSNLKSPFQCKAIYPLLTPIQRCGTVTPKLLVSKHSERKSRKKTKTLPSILLLQSTRLHSLRRPESPSPPLGYSSDGEATHCLSRHTVYHCLSRQLDTYFWVETC